MIISIFAGQQEEGEFSTPVGGNVNQCSFSRRKPSALNMSALESPIPFSES